MQTEDLITIVDFCTGYQVDASFVNTLHQYGFIEVTTIGPIKFLVVEDLPRIEKIIRLHTELDINLEGIDAIIHLLEKMDAMENEMKALRNKLRVYEGF